MSVILLLLSVLWCVSASTPPPRFYPLEDAHIHFKEFISKFDKRYNDYEKKQRFEIFKENLKVINRINEENPNILLGITHVSDLTNEEFIRMYTGLRTDTVNVKYEVLSDDDIPMKVKTFKPKKEDAPESFDWREQNVVTRVRQQGLCGSCWAHSVIGLLESQHAIQTGELLELSEQQLVDCDITSKGCCGGLPWHAVEYVKNTGGIMEGETYMYRGFQDFCRFDGYNVVAKVNATVLWDLKSQEKIKQLLFLYGPISIGLKAKGLSFYMRGVIAKGELCTGSVNHAVLLVGYGVDNKTGQPYWLVKNSWGHHWGEQGYFRLARGEGEESCGIQSTYLTTALLASTDQNL